MAKGAPPADRLSDGVRLDVWLWAARFFKTRSLAKEAIERGRIGLAGEVVRKPARTLRVGDRLRVERGGEVYCVDVLAIALQRGPAAIAQSLYREGPESIAERQQLRELRRLAQAGFQPPEQKPDKRARRKLSGLKQKDDGLPPWFPR